MKQLHQALLGFLGLAAATAAAPALASEPTRAPESGPGWLITYSGVDFAKDSNYFYTGALVSLNRDFSRSGLVLQLYSGYAAYEYDNPAVAGGVVDGDGTQLSGMLGYLFVQPGVTVGLYAGVDWQNYDLTPNDPTNRVQGSEAGFRVGGDIRMHGPQHYASLEGYYSTAFDSYWARGRVGANMGGFVVGPEGVALGSDGWDAQRAGAFMMTKLNLTPRSPVELTISGGYQFTGNTSGGSSGGEGAYGAVGISFGF